MSTQERLITIDEYEQFIALPEHRERRFELINGVIVEMSPTEEHGLTAVVLASSLHQFVRQHDLGRVGVEVRYQMPSDEHNAVIPDVSFMSKARALPVVDQGSVPQMPDLAIEIKSPDDSIIGLREKAQYYLSNGARRVWLVFPKQRIVEIYRPGQDVEILTEDDTLSGSDVLPGFSLAVREVFNIE